MNTPPTPVNPPASPASKPPTPPAVAAAPGGGGPSGGAPYIGKSFLVWTADGSGTKLLDKDSKGIRPRQDPTDRKARQIIFSPNDTGQQPAPPEQVDLAVACERVVHALNHLYPETDPASEPKFRLFYHDLFGVAQLGVEMDKGFDTNTAKKELDRIKRDLIEHEGPRVKNDNVKEQLRWAAWVSIPFLLFYVILSRVPDNGHLSGWLIQLGASRTTLANFMLLWTGCCLGVCLSYVLRKQDLTLEDLVTPESDYLTPAIRLGLAGTLTMLLVMLSMLDIFDLTIAKHKLSALADPKQQMLAFLAGVVCGLGERVLPAKFMSKTTDLIGGIK